MSSIRNICLLGLGEVGSVLAGDLLSAAALRLAAWDRQFADPGSAPSRFAASCPDLCSAKAGDTAAENAELVISAVTAAEDLEAARSVLPGLQPGAWFLDLNSVSPASRQAVAECVEAAGGRYVEGAIMSPISPRRIASPILVGGPHARELVPLARNLGFTGLEFCADSIGRAAATKLCRSVVVKGMESLLVEALAAARHYGVEDAVIASLANVLPHPDWPEQARYMMSRSLRHGTRRAAEMCEAAATVAGAGIEPWMSEACARRQAWGAEITGKPAPGLAAMLDELLAMNDANDTNDAKDTKDTKDTVMEHPTG